MLLQIRISRSTVSVSTSRGAPPSTLSVKGQIETVKVKGTVEHSACVQWIETGSGVVLFSMNNGSWQVRLVLLLKSWDQWIKRSVWVYLFCLCECNIDIGLKLSCLKIRNGRSKSRVGIHTYITAIYYSN